VSATPLVTLALHREQDVVVARQRSRLLAQLLGFEGQDQTRIATAVSEIARNAFEYAGGGRVEFQVELRPRAQALVIRVSDQGAGIADPAAILEGRYRSKTGLGVGISGSRRIMDSFEIETSPRGGTTVVMTKRRPLTVRPLEASDLPRVVDAVSHDRPHDSMAEVQRQNQELLAALEALRLRDEERKLLLERERSAREMAEAATLARDSVLSVVSHDLRNPLNAVLSVSLFLLEVTTEGTWEESWSEQLRIIVRATRRANRLIEDLLDVTRIEQGELTLAPAAQTPASLVEEGIEMLRSSAWDKGVELVTSVSADLPAVLADRDRLLQVLDNLGGNAVKFAQPGGVVEMRAERRGDAVRFSVIDDGPGMTADQLEHAFDRFWQAERADRRGVGLGLSIAHGIVRAHGGSLEVVSQPGAGCVFRFDLPLATVDGGVPA
jgi:signal transduction histidine kinase